MTTHDATSHPMDDPEQLGRAFSEVFDLVDETVEGISDVEVEQRLRQMLGEPTELTEPTEQVEPVELDLGRLLSQQGWNASLDPANLINHMTGQEAWDAARCALHALQEQVAV